MGARGRGGGGFDLSVHRVIVPEEERGIAVEEARGADLGTLEGRNKIRMAAIMATMGGSLDPAQTAAVAELIRDAGAEEHVKAAVKEGNHISASLALLAARSDPPPSISVTHNSLIVQNERASEYPPATRAAFPGSLGSGVPGPDAESRESREAASRGRMIIEQPVEMNGLLDRADPSVLELVANIKPRDSL